MHAILYSLEQIFNHFHGGEKTVPIISQGSTLCILKENLKSGQNRDKYCKCPEFGTLSRKSGRVKALLPAIIPNSEKFTQPSHLHQEIHPKLLYLKE